MLCDFNQNFTILTADNNQLLKECLKLRYKIFCQEKKIINYQTDSEIETDLYDDYSVHCLLMYKPTQQYIGTVRLILGQRLHNKPFPIEVAARNVFYDVIDYEKLNRDKSAEISRLGILPEFRPKLAVLGIIRAIIGLAITYHIDYLYAGFEPRIQRVLQRIGVHFREMSPMVEYHGKRQCFLGLSSEIVESARKSHPMIWEVITNNGELKPKSLVKNSSKKDDEIYNYR